MNRYIAFCRSCQNQKEHVMAQPELLRHNGKMRPKFSHRPIEIAFVKTIKKLWLKQLQKQLQKQYLDPTNQDHE